jgi:threonine dehydrogenase-like Zn-dependent dehydrogenase
VTAPDPALERLPACPPSSTVALELDDPRNAAVAEAYRSQGVRVLDVSESAREADLAVMPMPASVQALRAALTALRPGGRLAILGLPDEDLTLPSDDVVLAEIDVLFVEPA